jgi:uncharacterized protein
MINEKLNTLKSILKSYESGIVAFSGGVDSSFLLKVALDTLGTENVLAVIGESETYAVEEFEGAKKIAKMIKAPYKVIRTEEICDQRFVENSPQRCYFCKNELFSKLNEVAKKKELKHVFEGSNFDDIGDHRPGMQAAKDLGVVSPLKDAKLTKDEIRYYSKQLGLPTWSKPAMACLSSRFPYGHEITVEELKMVEEAENFLRQFGFAQQRVRHHGKLARIEVETESLNKLLSTEIREKIITKLKEIGYVWISIDLQGFRSGSFNESLKK